MFKFDMDTTNYTDLWALSFDHGTGQSDGGSGGGGGVADQDFEANETINFMISTGAENFPMAISAAAAGAAGAGSSAVFGPSDNVTSYNWPVRDPLYIVIPITIIYVTIFVVGLLGNVVTCIVICRSRYLHTVTNYFLFSLAISDIILLLSGLPVEMHSMWRRYPDVFGEVFCVARGLASETSANATVLTITAFTIERYLAICKPFIIQKWNNKLSRVVRQIIAIWIVSIILAVPQALQFGIVPVEVGRDEKAPICMVKEPLIEHSFEIATFVFFVFPMLLITALYILIGLTLRNASRVNESKLRLRKSLSSHKREVGQQRVLKMLVAICLCFFLCWCPFHAQRLIWKWGIGAETSLGQTVYHIATYLSGVLYYVATCVNPVLYHTMSLKFRHAFKETMGGCCACCGVEGTRRQGYRHTQSTSASGSSRSNGLILTEVTTSLTLNGCHSSHSNGHGQHHCFGRLVSL